MVFDARDTSTSELRPGSRSSGMSVSASTGAVKTAPSCSAARSTAHLAPSTLNLKAVTATRGSARNAAGLSAKIATVAHEKRGSPSGRPSG
eukprot:scaffold35605_cov31-Tisochrysis_lutea.AAC.5